MSDTLVLHGAHILDKSGSFVDGLTVVVTDGIVTRVDRTPGHIDRDARHLDLDGRWLMPGVVDCHSHITWNDFHTEDRESATESDRRAATLTALDSTLAAGVTSLRDAGGADAALRDAVNAGAIPGPRMQASIAIIDNAEQVGPEGVRRRVRDVLDAGADWIKLLATGGVMAPEGSDLESAFSGEEFRVAVHEASSAGARVMVHAWGGPAIGDAIAAGVASIEHGMFLSEKDAQLGAAAGVTLVPTLTIYAEVAEMIRSGSIPDYVAERTERIAVAHPLAVRRARDAGMPVALGSDFGTAAQHGRNLTEIAALARAGLGTEGALLAATVSGANLLGDKRRGLIESGWVFDAIVLQRDPGDVTVFEKPGTVVSVFTAGRELDDSVLRQTTEDPPTPQQ